MLAPFALFTACVGLTPEEQAEYKELQSEVRRIQVEEIRPRQETLQKILEGGLVVDIGELQEQVNQIRNKKLGPLEHQLAGLQSGGQVLAAPGTRIELEELNRRLAELGLLYTGLQGEIAERRGQLEAAKSLAGQGVEVEITLLEIELKALRQQLEELFRESDLRVLDIDAAIADLRELLETLEPDSADADDVRAGIAGLEAEREAIHAEEAAVKADAARTIDQLEADIHALQEERDSRHHALVEQFGDLVHGLEVSLHDVSEEKEDVVRRIHGLELSGPEELQRTIDELEGLIAEIVTTELRPLIERINGASEGGGPNSVTREQLRADLEEWLTRIAGMRARMSELNARSFQSLLSGFDISGLTAFGN